MSMTFWIPDQGEASPEFNLSNVNASRLLDTVGIDCDYCGSIHPVEFPKLRERIKEEMQYTNDAYIYHKLGMLLSLIYIAEKSRQKITWG